MYFAWLGFYTTSMLYPAVIGFVLWMLTESDQVRRTDAAGEIHFERSSRGRVWKIVLCWCRFRRAATSAAWCLHSSTWCGPHSSWSAGRGRERSWRTSGEPWTRPRNPWRNRGPNLGFGRRTKKNVIFTHQCFFSTPSLCCLLALCREWSAAVPSRDVRNTTILRGGGVCSGGWSVCPFVSSASALSSWSCSSASSCRSVSCQRRPFYLFPTCTCTEFTLELKKIKWKKKKQLIPHLYL